MSNDSKKLMDDLSDKWPTIVEKLREKGLDLEALCGENAEGTGVKVMCIAPNLGESVQEMGQVTRGETVMVRIDEDTRKTLDAWIETGYFKSRSEAAALFMREGLKIRASELAKLKGALKQVEKAKSSLREKARELFGDKKEK